MANDVKRDQCWLENKIRLSIRRKEHEHQHQLQQTEHRAQLAQRQFKNRPNVAETENRCYQRAVQEHERHWHEQERKRGDHVARLRSDRIENRSLDVANEQRLRQKCARDRQFDRTNCRINGTIDFAFDHQQRSKRAEQIRKHRAIISRQIVSGEKRRSDEVVNDRTETNRAIVDEAEKNDKGFFEYATRLLNDAQSMGYPLNPLQKVIGEYKRQNALMPRIDDLPHLKSHIGIGVAAAERKAKVV